MTIAAFITAWFLHFLAALSPGPAVLLCARIAATEGMRVGVFYAVGVAIGGCLWAAAALTGLSLLFELAPSLLVAFKVAGGLFLVWIGWKMWRHAPDPLPEATPDAIARTPMAAVQLGIVTQMANPKTAVFFGAVFVSTVPAHPSPAVFALLLTMVFVNEVGVIAAVARVFSVPPMRRAYARLKSIIDRTFGGMLALLGVKVALQ